MDSTDTNIQELEGSELGTKEYWEKCYDVEIKNYKSHKTDTGEVWFGEDSMLRIVTWIMKNEELISMDDAIVDLGKF